MAEPPLGARADSARVAGARRPDAPAAVRPRPLRPAAAADAAGQPLRPWTIPNAIGFVRLALIPVFLVVALSSSDGTGALRRDAVRGDRLGRLRRRDRRARDRPVQPPGRADGPVTDRLLVISGVVVCWHFQLLPRWALAVLVARELVMLALGRYGLARGVELRINWPGRLAVAPVMGAFFFAMVGLGRLGEVLLYIGLALALVATVLYVRDGGSRQLRASARRPMSSQAQPDRLGYTADSSWPARRPARLRPARAGASPREETAPMETRFPTSAR